MINIIKNYCKPKNTAKCIDFELTLQIKLQTQLDLNYKLDHIKLQALTKL